ncbi:MAG: hypothetical protein ACRESS_12385 [Stenotrophobium sp.]
MISDDPNRVAGPGELWSDHTDSVFTEMWDNDPIESFTSDEDKIRDRLYDWNEKPRFNWWVVGAVAIILTWLALLGWLADEVVRAL